MPEIETPMPAVVISKRVLHEYNCDKCEKPVVTTGVILTSEPPLFQHKCVGCEVLYTFRVQYPRMEHHAS